MRRLSSELTPHVAAQVLFVLDGPQANSYPPGSFVTLLIRTMAHADRHNLARFYLGFPGYVDAVELYKIHDGGVERLRTIAADAEEAPS
jgi:hypothetical protein